MTGLLTEHCHWKVRLFKQGLVISSKCDRWKQAPETAPYILGDCKALATLRFRHLSNFSWNQTTLRISLHLSNCGADQRTNRTAQTINLGWSARVTHCLPFLHSLLYNVLKSDLTCSEWYKYYSLLGYNIMWVQCHVLEVCDLKDLRMFIMLPVLWCILALITNCSGTHQLLCISNASPSSVLIYLECCWGSLRRSFSF